MRRATIHRWLSPMLAAVAVGLLPVAAATTDLARIGGWGLAAVLGPAAWASLLCAVAACVAELQHPSPRIPMLTVATGVLILCSFGMPSVVEPAARFSTAWQMSGFVDAIAQGGVAPVTVDARFSWPAFFAQWAFFRDAGGATQLDSVLRWFPPAINAVWATAIYAMARSILGGTRTPWVAAWLFLGLNWIQQDYFSPQATGIVLLLTVITFVLGPLATRRIATAGGAVLAGRWRRVIAAVRTPSNRPGLPPRQLLLIWFCLGLCVLAVAPAHQLTPFAIIVQLALLAAFGRFRGRGLLLVAIVAVVAYILIGARSIWFNQLSLFIGGGGGAALQAGIADRITGDTGQVVVKYLSIAVPALTWLLAIIGARVHWRRTRDLVPIGLAVMPMGFAAVQSYGGELILRIVLYGLPILTILGTEALRALVRRQRQRGGPFGRRRIELVLAAGMALLFATLVLIRGGNDGYQLVTPQDVALLRTTIAQTAPGRSIASLISDAGPSQVAGVADHRNGVGIDQCIGEPSGTDPVACIVAAAPDVIISYPSTERKGVVLDGLQPGWSLRLAQELAATGKYRITTQDGYDLVLVRV
ncbi:hypothetical protein [Pseudonocardia sp. GCM10023141]|uniref:hypothetical protein n=1 Tax=Pseudonocardia sp. GCM10023141 TaxID=3252653 RepID=UPI00360FBB85